MNQNQFEQITKRMERRYGKMRKGSEDGHTMLLMAMESNLLKTYRKNLKANSRRVQEAILLALYEVEKKITGEAVDVSAFESEENVLLRDALLQAFDPFVNKNVYALLLHEDFDFQDQKELENYYGEPVLCLMRIKESVEFMMKKFGSNGYFKFLEDQIGITISNDDEMHFAVSAKM